MSSVGKKGIKENWTIGSLSFPVPPYPLLGKKKNNGRIL
jgi:hypothetical protein